MAITSQAVQAKRDLRIGDKIFTFLKYFLLILFSIIALIRSRPPMSTTPPTC